MLAPRPYFFGVALFLLTAAPISAASVTTEASKLEAIPVRVLGGDASTVQVRGNNEVELLGPKFVFANTYGAMPLRRIDVYAKDNVSGYYTRYGGGNGDPFMTLYVYPVEQPFADEVSATQAALVNSFKASPAVSSLTAKPIPDAASGCYSGNSNSVPVETCFWLAEREGYYLKVRLTIPNQGTSDATGVAAEALESIPWTWTPATPTRPAN